MLLLVITKGTAVFDKLLPQLIDNRYSGSKIALWLFGLIVSVHTLQSVMAIVNGRSIAQSADGIPLENYPAAAAQTILAIFAVSSFRRLIISLICAVVLFRYRSAVPLMFVVLGLSYLGRRPSFHQHSGGALETLRTKLRTPHPPRPGRGGRILSRQKCGPGECFTRRGPSVSSVASTTLWAVPISR